MAFSSAIFLIAAWPIRHWKLTALAPNSAAARCPRRLGNRKLRSSHSRRDRFKRRLRLGAVGTAGLGHVGTAAAALAAERFGAATHEVDRVETPHQIGRDADHEASLTVACDPHDGDNAGADMFLAVVRKAPQILDLDSRHDTSEQLDVAG